MLDIIVTSSCRKIIVKTFESFFEKIKYSGEVHIKVNIDVLNPKNLSFIKNYLYELGRLREIKIDVHINANPAKNWYEAHALAIGYLFSRIETPFYFHLEDDWLFLKKIDLDSIVRLMEKYSFIDHIRFSRRQIGEKTRLYHLSDEITEEYLTPNIEVVIDGISLVQIPTWSFNPHLGRTSVIKNFANLQISENPEKYICHKYQEVSENGKIYIYGKIGDRAIIKDLGRNKIRQKIRKTRYIISSIIRHGKYPEYFGT